MADAAGLDLVLLSSEPLPPQTVHVHSLPDNEALLTPMQPDGRQGLLHRYRARIAWDGGNALTLYAFFVAQPTAEEGPLWLAADGQHALTPPESVHFRVHRHQRPPAWVAEQVFYQVFPDRFARNRAVPSATAPATTLPWGSPVPRQRAAHQFYGGDLIGLVEQLPYLNEELGVTALYLNPIFSSSSNHRYDTRDYEAVDESLGGNAALASLRHATHARGMRLVLDAVVNHTGADHPWLRSHPHFYARQADGQPLGWKGHSSLPVLDFAQPDVQQAIYARPDAVLRRWLQPPFAIDGWRLDVIHMLGEGPGAHNNAHHVRAIRQAVRQDNPQAYLLGEHFSEATRWLQGDQEDGAMNYHGFTTPVGAWLAGLEGGSSPSQPRRRISTAQLEARLTQAMAAVPYANQLAQFNLLGSHDTARMLTLLQGDVALLQVAFTLLFTRPGVPCIYYGDEIGLVGGNDPECRGCFDWDRLHWQPALWAHCHRLARLRRSRSEWQRGATMTLAQGPDWWVYARFDAQAATLVGVNRGEAAQLQLPLHALPLPATRWVGWDGTLVATSADTVLLALPARGGACLMTSP